MILTRARDQKQTLVDQLLTEDEASKQRLAQQGAQLRQLAVVGDEVRALRDELDIWRAKVLLDWSCVSLSLRLLVALNLRLCVEFPSENIQSLCHTISFLTTTPPSSPVSLSSALTGKAAEGDKARSDVVRLRERLEDMDHIKRLNEVTYIRDCPSSSLHACIYTYAPLPKIEFENAV